MDATAARRSYHLGRLWKRYRGATFVLLTGLAIVLFYWTVSRTDQRGINNFLQDFIRAVRTWGCSWVMWDSL